MIKELKSEQVDNIELVTFGAYLLQMKDTPLKDTIGDMIASLIDNEDISVISSKPKNRGPRATDTLGYREDTL